MNFELALNNSVIMLPTNNDVDQPKTKSGHRVNEGNAQNMYFFYKKNHDFTKKKQQ